MGEKEIMSEERRGGRRGTEEREANAGAPLESRLVRYLFVDCLRSRDREEGGGGRGTRKGEKKRKSSRGASLVCLSVHYLCVNYLFVDYLFEAEKGWRRERNEERREKAEEFLRGVFGLSFGTLSLCKLSFL
jgi:hypothetical protein